MTTETVTEVRFIITDRDGDKAVFEREPQGEESDVVATMSAGGTIYLTLEDISNLVDFLREEFVG